jgi:hypothetical protein
VEKLEKRKEEEVQRREIIRRKKMQIYDAAGADPLFFSNILGTPEGRKLGLDEKLHAVARRCGTKKFEVICAKYLRVGEFFEVQLSKKVRAVVARSTFRSQRL